MCAIATTTELGETGSSMPVDPQWWLRGPVPFGARHRTAVWVTHLLDGTVDGPAGCPRCPRGGRVLDTLDHLLSDHGEAPGQAAEWLESLDADLYSLAVSYLASVTRTPD